MKLKLLFVIVLISTSCESNGDQNFEDLKKIEIGMTYKKVHQTMRNDTIESGIVFWDDSLISESYESGFGASDNFRILYSKKDSTVVEIEWGD